MFNDIITEIKQCAACPLRKGAKQVVPGAGSLNSEILFLGEAPGKDEDTTGVPFIGRAGELLFNTLAQIGITRDDIFITNVVKCRPPGNRNPTKQEVRSCSVHTNALIDIINPILIVAVGKFACDYLLSEYNITYQSAVGKVFKIDDRYIYVIRHPAYALHKRTDAVMAEVTGFILKIKEVLKAISEKKKREKKTCANS